jgi:pimeloyl-ACP methyl ester carboxylesterase
MLLPPNSLHARPLSRVPILLLLCLLTLNFFPLSAQNQPAPSPRTLADLVQHPDSWPKQVTLKVDVQMDIISNGKKVGSTVSPAGTTVDLISVSATSIGIQVISAQASVSPDQTDLWERVAPAASKVSVAPVPALPQPTAPVTTPHAPPPTTAPDSTVVATTDSGPPLIFDYEVTARDNFTKAAFRFWSPPYKQPVRGVIVLVPGLDGDGRGMLNSPAWQTLARKYGLALVACFMQGGNYYNAPGGTGDALLEALKKFADLSGRTEISQVPLLLYGESAGGQFNYDFVLWKPERVMAFVVNKGGYYDQDAPDTHTCATPGLFFLGQKDSDLRINAITTLWTTGRKMGALWALAPQPNSGHEFSRTAPVAQIFFNGVLKNRLPDESQVSDGSPTMQPMQENQGWLGDLTTCEIHDGSNDASPDRTASWFPDHDSADAWKAFVSH